jgi:hypothetical protein
MFIQRRHVRTGNTIIAPGGGSIVPGVPASVILAPILARSCDGAE